MTAAEKPTDFQNNFLSDGSENSIPLLSEEDSDSVVEDKIHKMEGTNSSDSSSAEFPGTTKIENSSEELNSGDINLKKETEKSETEDDEWLDIMGSGDFKKKVITPGLGPDTRPHRGDYVIVNTAMYVNGKLFEEKDNLKFVVGDLDVVQGDYVIVNTAMYVNGKLFEEKNNLKFVVGDLDVVQGMDLIVCLMEKGEKAKVIIPSKLAYGTVGLLPDVPPDSSIECDIELKEVEPIDEEALTVSDRLKLGDEKRSRGNFFYERAQYIDAIHCYERAAEYLDGVRDGSNSLPEELQEVVNMRLKVYNNMAASHLKLNAYSAALKSVDAVLKVQPKNVKALFRKGKILGTQGSTDEAIACMKAAANLEPETKVIQQELTKLKNRKKKEEETQKAMYQRMFKHEAKELPTSASKFRRWSVISCGVLAVAIGSALAFRQYHT